MLLVLCAVVLLLPAFQVEGERYRRDTRGASCYRTFLGAVDIWCGINGHGGYQRFNYPGCTVTCNDGTETLKLPGTVCRNNSPPCKEDNGDAVSKWKEDLENRKADLLKTWCYCPKCY
ncbi:uncharacterized protein LOC120836531 [Ixodes scapularis]|uniref:uncharacterized protein LOC120836531 n=1 Tax=Ixodes scapularis TaxID=6945 RepID=UPI001A9CF199|nr:uncharacterized protein LOC120836531 [Ixodes scapularis]